MPDLGIVCPNLNLQLPLLEVKRQGKRIWVERNDKISDHRRVVQVEVVAILQVAEEMTRVGSSGESSQTTARSL